METLQPKLRFPEFRDNWKNKYFKEIYSFRSTNSLSRDRLNYENGLVKNIHYGDIHSKFNSLFKILNEQVPYINNDISLEKIPNENYLKEKDLVIADASEDYNDIGKCLEIIDLNEQDVLAGLHTFIARPDLHDMALGFGNYLMKSDYSKIQIKTIAQGTKVLSISTTRLSEIKLNIPSLDEQTKIANFLSSVDEKLNLLKQKKSLLEDYKKGIMQKIFNQEIRFRDDNGNDFEDWEITKLGDFANITTGSSNREDSNLDGDYTFFDRSQDIRSSNRFLFDAEAIIVPGEGQEFIPKYFKGKFDLHQRTYAIMNFGKNNGVFLFYSITHNKNHLNSHAVGSTVKSLRLPMFQSMPINLPTLVEQTKIANFLSAIDEKIELVSNQIQDTQEYKKGLLQQMFV